MVNLYCQNNNIVIQFFSGRSNSCEVLGSEQGRLFSNLKAFQEITKTSNSILLKTRRQLLNIWTPQTSFKKVISSNYQTLNFYWYFCNFAFFILIGSAADCIQKFHLTDRYCGRVLNTADSQTQNIPICGN